MNARQLMQRVMKRETAPRIPTMPQLCFDTAVRLYDEDWIDGTMRCLQQPQRIYDYVIRLARDVGCDGLRLFALSPPARLVREGTSVYSLAEDGTKAGQVDLLGGGRIQPFRPAAPIETLADAKQAVAALRYSDWQIEQLQTARARVPDLFVASNSTGLTLDTYCSLRGREQAYMDLIGNPGFVHSVFELILEFSLDNAERMAPVGLDALLIGDAGASASLISPQSFAEFCLPYYQRYCRHMAGRGPLIYMHICGNSSPILELMAESGVHCIEPLDTLAGVSVADAKARVGDRVSLMGGVNTVTLVRGTAADVQADAIRCCTAGGPYGYILAAADMVPPQTPRENLQALVDTATQSLWRQD